MDFVAIKVVYKKKAKGKFVPVYAIKTYRGSRNIAPLFLNSGLLYLYLLLLLLLLLLLFNTAVTGTVATVTTTTITAYSNVTTV